MAFSLFALLFVLPFCQCFDQASFYGNSFISIPLREAKGYTDIVFKFRTHLPDALLLLVAGTTDYCILRLDNGVLKLNINLGSGEFEVSSPPSKKLNDLQWHKISVTRREANLSLVIDNYHTVKKRLPGKFFELNVHNGLYVGGHRNYTDMFFGHLENFRGCLADLVYNGISVLERARRRQAQTTNVQSVTWNCATEFDADINQPMSFINDDSYLTALILPIKELLIWQLELKTLSDTNSIILYNTGIPQKLDTVSLELWKGKIKLFLKLNDNKIVELVNEIFIADGHWHKILVRIKSSIIELNVDSRIKSLKIAKLVDYTWETNNILYVGGIETTKRTRVISKGLKIPDRSFKGCIRYLKINEQYIGLKNARITEGLLNGCVWQYPCLTKHPCNNNQVCIQQGLDSYQCLCKPDFCTNSTSSEKDKIISRGSLATDLELLILEPLQVIEGQSTLITTSNLHVVLDYPKYGVSELGVIFHIVDIPERGNVVIDVWPHERNSFTLSDISKDKVYYVHDGSEHLRDDIVMEVEFSAANTFILPVYLQGKFRLVLNVNITPVNDAPFLNISSTTVLRLARGTKKIINRELLHANDPDTPSKLLVFNVIDSGSGHLEHIKKSGVAISSFTQQEIDNNEIVFVHHTTEADDAFLSVRVSDGIETSKLSKLRISAFPHYWRINNNTGLVLIHNTHSLITSFNLSFISNVPDGLEGAKYYIIQEPQYGVVETETDVNVWKKSSSFTSDDLRRHQIRYRHTTGKPAYDEFQFRTTLNGSITYTFRITFKKCMFVKSPSEPLQLRGENQGLITLKQLEYKTEPIMVPTISIVFIINHIPKYGYLYLSNSKYHINVEHSFTQEDVIVKNINYHLYKKSYSCVLDSFVYTAMAPGCKNVTGNVSIEYFPSEETSAEVKVTLRRLEVNEGATVNLDSKHLNIKSRLVTDLIYNITEHPKYGYLQVKEGTRIRDNIDYFFLNELVSNQLLYIHDDSETKHDSFHFLALSRLKDEDFQYSETFHIDIILKNDNSPIRVINKVFHVVVNSQKLLTGNDLKYVDADLDTTTSDIAYTCRELPNGHIYSLRNSSVRLLEFSQKDLDDSELIFKHNGPKYGKIKLWITDGHFNIDGILEVQASAPFVKINSKKKLITEHGKWAVFSHEHLSVDTNIFASEEDILYEIVTKPVYGNIVASENLEEVTNFTQAQIRNGDILYMHEESSNSVGADHVELRISCKDAINMTLLNIWILPSSYWDPLVVKGSHIVLVEESTSAVINKSILEVFQSDEVSLSDITYYIAEYPQNGYLTIVPLSSGDVNESSAVASFTQALINENRLVYVQSRSNETKDVVIFNVTNSMVWLNGLILDIKIIPEHLYLGSSSLNLNEGRTAALTETQLFVLTDYYKLKVMEYIILQQPIYGWMEYQGRNKKLSKFTHEQLIHGIVQYQHDGSENLQDEIVIIGVAEMKRSLPVVIPINITPVNDHKPQLVNNTGLVMWEGGNAVITNSMLAAIDADIPPDTLRFQVLNCWWGNVSIKSEPQTALRFFTQDLVDKATVVFRHQNGSEAKFTFNVSDGLHSTDTYSFLIKTKPVMLDLYKRSTLNVFPLQKKLLTPENLFATVSDPTRTIYFRITSPPILGRLLTRSDMKDNIFQVTSMFTQHDINDKKVFYEHTRPFEDLYATDSFSFTVESHLAQPLIDQKIKIDITVSSGGLDAYISIPKINVDEGGITNIKLNLSGVIVFLENHAGLKSPIIHASLVTPSTHGQVYYQQVSNVTIFTQQQLESGLLYYQHDHSDSLQDNIFLSLYLIPGYIILCNITVPIEVNPINDQPFKLVTPAPHFTVVQGENHTIKPSELSTEDADTASADIYYDVISGPMEGRMILLPELISVSHFSQEDIDQGRLVYIHDGVSLTDVFHLRVWDGKFRHEYTVLNIQVIPVIMNVSTGLPLYLQQGSNVVLFSHKQFIIETNTNVDKIRYIVKEGPRHGLIYVKDAPAVTFGQIELDNDDVMYMQTDMTTANDSVKIFVGLISRNTSVGETVGVNINVQPLMQIQNFSVMTGMSNRIGVSILDATPLAKLTNSNPFYTIVQPPQYGQIRKIIRSSGEMRNVMDVSITSFTHEEIQSGLIYLVTKNVDVGKEDLHDELTFILAATIFQPAVGKLKILIKATFFSLYSTMSSPSDPASREGGIHMTTSNVTRDYFLIVSMVIGVIVLGVTVILVIKCRTLGGPHENKQDNSIQPIPLPRPPDALMSTPSPIKQHLHDGFAFSLPAALPQCKVTPLSDAHTRYPYGIEEHIDDWSSCDASDPSCPARNNIMLRRNQYWV